MSLFEQLEYVHHHDGAFSQEGSLMLTHKMGVSYHFANSYE
jgi:hypothetical protein